MQMTLGFFLGALAMFVAVVSGIFGGVGFWSVVVRSLVSGLVFLGIGFVGERFLKSTISNKAVKNEARDDSHDSHVGTKVDLVDEDDGAFFDAYEDEGINPTNLDQQEPSKFSTDSIETDLRNDDEFSGASLAGLSQEDPINLAKGIQTILESEKE